MLIIKGPIFVDYSKEKIPEEVISWVEYRKYEQILSLKHINIIFIFFSYVFVNVHYYIISTEILIHENLMRTK